MIGWTLSKLKRFLRWTVRQRPVWSATFILIAGLTYCLLHQESAILIPYMFWSIPSSSLLMIPNEPAALATVQLLRRTIEVLDTALLVAFAGAIGAGVAAVIDQTVLKWFFGRKRVESYLKGERVRKILRWFRAFPFGTVVVFAFLPLPLFIVRFMAAASRYSTERYAGGVMLGKFCRLFVLGLIGGIWEMPQWMITALLISIIISSVFIQIRHFRRRHAPADN